MLNYNYYVYIISNFNNRVLYIGVTNDLKRRIYEHKDKLIKGFTSKYNINKLVFLSNSIILMKLFSEKNK